jgi:hypothetical protein
MYGLATVILLTTNRTSSKNDDALRDFEVEVSSKKKAVKRSPQIDSAWDDNSAFPRGNSKKDFEVGDRVLLRHTDATGTVAEIDDKGLGRITWDIPQSWHNPQAKDDICTTYFQKISVCDNLISVQELVPDSVMPDCNLDLTLLEPQKPTNIARISSESDIQECITMEMCDRSLLEEDMGYEVEKSTLSQLPRPAPPSQVKAIVKEQPTSVTASPQFLKLSTITSQDLLQSKTLQDCSPAPTAQEMSAVTSNTFFSSFPAAGMMRNGLLSEADTVPLPLLEKEYCWLPSPGALSSTGKGRPPGQTKQEGELKKLGLLQKDEVLNPDILCQWYQIPQSWLDPLESRAATELLENNERQQEIFSILELQRSHSIEFSTSIQSPDNSTLENFLEETVPQRESVPERKGRQRKGCLYKYVENKKLKDGTVASYPRVIGHRDPGNPTHWRWAFNWEEKLDGKWKNRSLSVKLGAVPLIQSMQKEGVSLGEIIGFIKRSKNK